MFMGTSVHTVRLSGTQNEIFPVGQMWDRLNQGDHILANTLEFRFRIQSDLNILEKWSEMNQVKFSKDKYKAYI